MKARKFAALALTCCMAIVCCAALAVAEVHVLSVTPAGTSDGADAYNTITVTFDQPMVPLAQLPEGDGTGPLTIQPAVRGKYRWQGTSTLSFTPAESLSPATEYEVTVAGKLPSQVTGDVLKNAYTWRFQTLRPALVHSLPRNCEKWVDLKATIVLYFNMPMDPRKVKSNESGTPAIRVKEIGADGHERDVDYMVRNAVQKDFTSRIYQMSEKLENTLILLPAQPFNKDSTCTVEIRQGLLARKGNLGMPRSTEVSFKTFPGFAYVGPEDGETVTPGYSLNLVFTNPVRMSDLVRNFSITPQTALQDEYDDGTFSMCDYSASDCPAPLRMKLKAGTTYHITLNGRLEDQFGQKLGKDINAAIVAGDYPERMTMPTGMGIVERYLPQLRHPISLVNIERLRLQKTLIPADYIVPFVSGDYTRHDARVNPACGFAVDRMWYPKINRNERTLLPLELKEVLGDAKSGIVFVQVSCEDSLYPYDSQYQQALLQVTGLGITGKFSPDGNLIYVSYLKTAMPVKGADIELRDDGNKVLWTGKTDDSGFAMAPGWEGLQIIPKETWKKPRVWVIVKKSGDLSFIYSDWGTGIYPYHFNIDYDWAPRCPEYQGYIFSERGIYRPGEPVYLKGMIREKRQGIWQIPRIREYKVFVKDARSAVVFRSTVTLSDYGSFDVVYNIDRNSPTGYYSVQAWEKDAPGDESGENGEEESRSCADRKIRLSSDFRVEEYKPATFEVITKNDREAYIIGDTVTVRVHGVYLTGSPMPGAEIRYAARLDPCWFSPEGYDGYEFGSDDWHQREYGHGDLTMAAGTGKLDGEGAFTFSYPLRRGGRHGSYTVISEASVTAPDRQQLSGRAATAVHGAEFYIGVKAESTFIEKGKAFRADIIAVDADGRKIVNRQLSCSLIKEEWRSVRVSGTGGRWEWQTEKADVIMSSFTVLSGQAPVRWEYKPGKAGYYYFNVAATDGRGNAVKASQYFYVTGRDYCAWQRDDTDRIELVCDKARYKPGDTAKILVKSPYEDANAVVTVEREGIISKWRTRVKGSADTIEVPIKHEYLPNVYVCVMLYQGRAGDNVFSADDDADGEKRDLGKPSFKIGYTNLPVDPNTKHLSVSVTTDKKEYRPGQQVTVQLKVLDSRNAGTPAEVDVAVSDLGILSLIDYMTPNPFPYFYGPRPLSVETAETRLHIIGQRNYGEKGENRGGGGGFIADVDPRMKFIPTAYWNPKIMTDPRGNASFSFTLPGNLSSFRVMATAQTRDASFGCGDTRFAVNKPFMLKPSLPRFAMTGDRFTAGVLCHNNTQADGKGIVQVEVKGITLEGEYRKEIALKKGEVKEVTFDFRAEKPGNAEFIFKGALGSETDGLQWSVPVKVPQATEAVATFGSTPGSAQEAVKIPSHIYDEISSVDITVAPTALAGMKGGLEYLFEYPYGCLEQKTSMVLPLVLGGELIDTFNLAPLKEHSGAEIINSYLKEAGKFQTISGGFGFWEGDHDACPYLTCYVTWVLSQAKAQGYAVDTGMMAKACDYLKAYLRDDPSIWRWPYSVNAELTARAFCVYVLSLNGQHEQPYINGLYAKRDQMPPAGKIYLLKAIHYEKMNQAMADTLVRELYNRAKYAPTEVHFEAPLDDGMAWIWETNVRTTAAVLQGLLEVNGGFADAGKVAKWLANQRKSGRWSNTQDNAYVFYALNEYVKRYEKETPDFTATAALAGKEILNEIFRGRTLNSKAVKVPVTGYPRDTVLPVDFRKTGDGRLYYDLRMTYAPRGVLNARDEGLYVDKRIEPFRGTVNGNTYRLAGKYKVTLRVKSDQDRKFVVVNDPLPAGFEIVNMSLATESATEERQFNQSLQGNGIDWWGGFDHSEQYDDRMLLFANYLKRGEHTYSYLIQATTAGEFLMSPTKAEEMYTPEVFGRTGQGSVIIR